MRPILHRASISEMVVPYGDPSPQHGWKNAFDAGEWGLGRMTQPLTLGCDCVGEIHYFDATIANEQGKPWTIKNAICMHEEDYGILWKHVDLLGGRSEVRRSRRLVVSFVATVGNYEYGFFWYFYLDGNIQLRGVASCRRWRRTGRSPRCESSRRLSPPHHQHMFNARLDSTSTAINGSTGRGRAHAADRTAMAQRSGRRRRAETELARSAIPTAHRVGIASELAECARAADLLAVPTMSTPTLLAHPDSPISGGPPRYATVGDALRPTSAARASTEPAQGRRRCVVRAGPVVRAPTSSSGTRSGSRHLCGRKIWPVIAVEYTPASADAGRFLRPQPRTRHRPAKALRTRGVSTLGTG